MPDDRWSMVEEIYHAALERAPEQRAAFIAEACASDAGVREEVESLLAQKGRGDALLERSNVHRFLDAMMPVSFESRSLLGPYEILARAGKGGMGEVYKARDTRLGRVVAIKVLPVEFEFAIEHRSRIKREANAIASLNHAHICVLFDIGEQNGLDYLVMEYLEGETLSERLKRGALPLEEALRIATQILEGLSHAHRNGIVHCDLKPANIMLTANGVKLLDFGLARLVARPAGSTGDGSIGAGVAIVGTLQYMAPEQLEGKPADARADIHAFGAVLYEMLSGQRAFAGETQVALISAIMTKQPPSLRLMKPSVSGGLEHVIENCLAKDVEARWQSAADVLLEMKWLTGSGADVVGGATETRRSRRAA